MRSRSCLAMFVSAVIGLPALAEVSFTAKPTARKAGAGTTIAFAVVAETDVEVAILDARGKVVRHLVAGQLGKNAPAPLTKDSLKQELVWDGKTDLGRPAQAGPFKVRVSLGTMPTLDRMIGDNPAELGDVRGFAVGPKGELFVLHNYASIHPDDSTGFCSVFSREGKYLRTILPYNSITPDDKLPGIRKLKLTDGRSIPYLYNGEQRCIVPAAGEIILHQPTVTKDGTFVLIGHIEMAGTATRYNNSGLRQVVAIHADGSMPAGGPLKTILARGKCNGSLAVAPDSKTFYAADIAEGSGKNAKVQHAVYKFTLDAKDPTPFIGSPDEAGAGAARLNGPRSVAVDGEGNIYVSDRGNNRIAQFSPQGEFLAETKVESPDRLAVHAKTKAIYVTAGLNDHHLLKFDSMASKEPSAKTKVPYWVRANDRDQTILALDSSGETAIAYYGTQRSKYLGGFKVLRIEDKGKAFGKAEDVAVLSGGKTGGAGPLLMLTLDRKRGRLYMDEMVYDLASGKIEPGLSKVVKARDNISGVGTKGGNGAVGLDGMMYLMGYSHWMRRYDGDLHPVSFGDAKTFEYTSATSLRLRARGVTADPQGNIYALWQNGSGADNNVALHGPDGQIKNPQLVASVMRGLESVRLDYQGNIYLMVSARPRGQILPAEFGKPVLPPVWKSGENNTHNMNWYEFFYGHIVKFPSTGGSIVEGDAGLQMEYGRQADPNKIAVQNAEWAYFGASPALSWRQKYPDTCDCESAQFDVDAYGRSFFPDAVRFQVSMLDTGGNDLGSFGRYGNADEKGGEKDIPMYWPYTVAAADDGMVYVGDRLNRRVLAIKLNHAAEETCLVQ